MLADILKHARTSRGIKARELANKLDVDATLISRFESGNRIPTEFQLDQLVATLNLDKNEVKAEWLAEKVVRLVAYQPEAREALILAESRIEYLMASKTYDLPVVSDTIIDRIRYADELKTEWQAKRPLNHTQLLKMKEYFQVENTFESNRIEGNTLTLQETQLVVNEGLTISGKSMREHLEAVNHVDALNFLEELVGAEVGLTKRNVLDLHRLILKGVDTKNAGVYRSVPVRISGSKHEPAQIYMIEKLMEDFFSYFNKQKKRLHPIIMAAEVHERLVSIHPFIDGNGRTSRLLMNMVLLQNGYSLTHIKGDGESRLAYYKALESVQLDNNPEPFYELVVDATIHSLEEHLKMV